MRRGIRPGLSKPTVSTTRLSRELDWVVDQWQDSTPEKKLELILAKIRHEESSKS